MRSLFTLVPAFLLFLALVILAQAPDGAAPAFKGPDAVAANLVNTSCAGCHSLDRVKNKVAEGLLQRGWAIPTELCDTAREALRDAEDYSLDKAGKVQKR